MNDLKRLGVRGTIEVLTAAALILAVGGTWHARRRAADAEVAWLRERERLAEQLRAEESRAEAALQEAGTLRRLLRQLEAERQAQRDLAAELLDRRDRAAAGKRSQPDDTLAGTRYTLDQLKEAIAASNLDFGAVVEGLLPPEALRAILHQREADPEAWAAAASLLRDPAAREALLQEANTRHPGSPVVLAALVETMLSDGRLGAQTAEAIRQLADSDPTNSLPDLFEAIYLARGGDLPGAVQALAQANSKNRLVDYRIGQLMGRSDCLVDAGCADAAALCLAAFGLDFPHLGMVRELAAAMSGEIDNCLTRGQPDRARQLAAQLLDLGQSLSASGRFLIYDRVGIALQNAGLNAERRAAELTGRSDATEALDRRLEAIEERAQTIETMVQLMGQALGAMSEAEVSAYVSRAVLDGEFAALQSLPVVETALRTARQPGAPR